MNALMLYLLQVAICHTVFYLLYRTLYANLAYFNFNRIYLLNHGPDCSEYPAEGLCIGFVAE